MSTKRQALNNTGRETFVKAPNSLINPTFDVGVSYETSD